MPSPEAPIRFDDTGRGAPALVFVHGFSCDRTDWTAQMARFSPTHRCIAPDLPAHGASPRAAMASVDVPTLAIQSTVLGPDMPRVPVPAGTLSPFCRALRDALPGATIATIACGHFTMLERSDATDAAIASFLGRLAARRPGG